MSDNKGKVSRRMIRVPARVRSVPAQMRRVPVKKAARAGRSVALWLGFFALFLICILVSLGRWWAPVYVETHRHELMEKISDAAGVDLVSDDMTLVWSRWGPRLQLSGLTVRSRGGEEVTASLEKAQFSANIYKMLVLGKLIIDDVEVEGLHLDVLRSVEGKWRLALSTGQRSVQEGRDWFEVLGRFRWLNLKDSVITFRDLQRQRQYVVDGVTVVANHFNDRYRISVDGDLPPQLGKKLQLIADLRGTAGNELSGEIYLGMEQFNLTEFGTAVGSDETRFSGTIDQLEYWHQINAGDITNGQLQFIAENLSVQRSDESRPWTVDLAELALGWERQDNNWDVWLDDLTVASDGEAWRSGYTRFIHSADGTIQAQGEQLRLGSIALLLAQLTQVELVEKIAEAAHKYDPQGDLVAWRLLLEPDQSGKMSTAFEGLISGLSVSSVDNKPGIRGLDALIRVQNNRLTARVNSVDLHVDVPAIFPQPLTFDNANGLLTAQFDPEEWWINSDSVIVEKDDASVDTAFEIRKSAGIPGFGINLSTKFENVDAQMLPSYYPEGIMKPELTQWLKDGLLSGSIKEGDFILRGYTPEFPFVEGEGVMVANFKTENVKLDYSPGWPLITEGDVNVQITGKGLTVAGEGNFDGVPVENFELELADFGEGRIRLNAELETTGAAVREFAKNGPLKDTLAQQFDDVFLQGPMRLKLSPVIALRSGDETRVNGSAIMKGSRVKFDAVNIDLSDVRGEVPFDDEGLKGGAINAKLYGVPVDAKLKRLKNNKGLQVDARAHISPANWLMGQNSTLASYVSGESNWRILVQMLETPSGAENIAVSLTSDLKGVKVHAPAPVGKSNRTVRPFHIEGLVGANDSSRWNFSYGEDLGGKFTLDANGDLLSLALGAGETVPTMPQDGVRIRANWPRADVAEWYDFVDACCLQEEEGESSGYLDVYAAVQEAGWYGTPIGGGSLSMIDDENGLEGRIESGVAAGSFTYNYRVGEEAWDINLHQVNLTPFIEAEDDGREVAPTDPRTIPVTRWNIDSLRLRDVTIEDITISTSPVDEGMRIDRIIISTDDYTGTGKGLWQFLKSGEQHSEIELFLHTNDLGDAFNRVGLEDAITGGRGQVTLNLLWQDALYEPDVATLSGAVKLEMAEGRFNSVDPGAGRVFGLLALQTLPQRLALDFSDLSEGLSYTQVKGEFKLANGTAETKYLVLEGPIGAVNVAGDIDYVNSRFDQQIAILPNVGGSLPVIGAVVGGPVAAAGVFLADKIFRSLGIDVNRVGRVNYTLTGSFDDPVLTQLVLPDGNTRIFVDR